MHKKKTSVKKSEKSPIFNEAIIFSVPAHTLQVLIKFLFFSMITIIIKTQFNFQKQCL